MYKKGLLEAVYRFLVAGAVSMQIGFPLFCKKRRDCIEAASRFKQASGKALRNEDLLRVSASFFMSYVVFSPYFNYI